MSFTIAAMSSNGKQPDAPTIGTATAGSGNATVTFTASVYKGKSNFITSYTATSSPGGVTAASGASPITVSGLTSGTAYTFTVVARTELGSGAVFFDSPASAASNSVTPTSATLRRCTSFQISIACCTSTGQCGALGAGATCSPANGFFDPDAC